MNFNIKDRWPSINIFIRQDYWLRDNSKKILVVNLFISTASLEEHTRVPVGTLTCDIAHLTRQHLHINSPILQQRSIRKHILYCIVLLYSMT